jgi:hypothetical protein
MLRQSIWKRSLRVLHRRRLVRRGLYLAGLAACYLAGLLTMHLRAPSAVERERIVYRDRPAPPAPVPVEKPIHLEQRAIASEKPSPELFRRAGDAYAHEQHDLEAALRCYGRSLDAGGDEQLVISADDHWLLMAIKDARKKEKNDAKHPH